MPVNTHILRSNDDGHIHLGTSEPALSSSLKTMYAVSAPPMRKKESTEGKALSTASKATPWDPLEETHFFRIILRQGRSYLKSVNVGKTFLAVMLVSCKH